MRMSLYQLHRCVWDSIRAGAVSSGPGREFDVSRYDLDETERKAFETRDVAELYRLGLHPVLLNGFCRASGFSRNEYRSVLQVFASTEQRKARWQK
jgi:hypothetical protein